MRAVIRRVVRWALDDPAEPSPLVPTSPKVEAPQSRAQVDPPPRPFEGQMTTFWLDSEAAVESANEALPDGERDRPIRQVARCAPGDHYVTHWPRCFRCEADVTEEKGMRFVRLSMPSAAAEAMLPLFAESIAGINASMAQPGADMKSIAARANALSTLAEQISRQLKEQEQLR